MKIFGVVFDILAIPMDLVIIGKAAFDVHKYRTKQKSNSNRANELDKCIKELEKNKILLERELANLKSPLSCC